MSPWSHLTPPGDCVGFLLHRVPPGCRRSPQYPKQNTTHPGSTRRLTFCHFTWLPRFGLKAYGHELACPRVGYPVSLEGSVSLILKSFCGETLSRIASCRFPTPLEPAHPFLPNCGNIWIQTVFGRERENKSYLETPISFLFAHDLFLN